MMNHRALATLSLLAASVLAAPGIAMAAPIVNQIAGPLSQGQTLVVTGNGFGYKPQAAPILWDDFESGAVGTQIQGVRARVGQWDTGAGSENTLYSTDGPRTGLQGSKHDFVRNYNVSLAKNGSFPTIYLDFWVRPDLVDNRSRNWKPWRFYGNNDKLQIASVYFCSGRALGVEDYSGASFQKAYWEGRDYVAGAWHHVQVVYKQSAPGMSDGVLRSSVNSVVLGVESDAIMTRNSESVINQIRIGHYWAREALENCPANGGANIFIDDVYIDTSHARVEVGNNQSYAAATHREILIPASWSDGRIELTVPAMTFKPGERVYLFVTDENNVTQAVGTPIIVGDSSPAPKPPDNVVVN